MIKAKIFNTEQAAKSWNHEEAVKRGCQEGTSYWFPMKQLTSETTLTKSEYSELYNIPVIIINEEGVESSNPEYTALSSTIKVNKWACVVGDELDIIDEEGDLNIPEDVADISDVIQNYTGD